MTNGESKAERNREDLFEEIMKHHLPVLKRLCMGYEASPDLRKELMQEILMNLWRSLPAFRQEASLKTWMYRVALNVATRHSVAASRNPINHNILWDGELNNVSDNEEDAEKRLDENDAIERMRELIRSLPELDRQIVLLYLEEVPQADIAEITGLSTDNISTKVNRIKRLLARKIRRSM